MAKNPRTKGDWNIALSDNDLEGNATIHDLDQSSLKSGSEIGSKQYLLLRVLWHPQRQALFSEQSNRENWIPEDIYQSAIKVLEGLPGWEEYYGSFEQTATDLNKPEFPMLGTFSAARYQQCAILRTKPSQDYAHEYIEDAPKEPPPKAPPKRAGMEALMISEDPSIPSRSSNLAGSNIMSLFGDNRVSERDDNRIFLITPLTDILSPQSPAQRAAYNILAEDEQIVNSALITFLSMITKHFKIKAHWTIEKRAFRFRSEGRKGFTAKVDGCLLSHKNSKVHAIIEVKPCVRETKKTKIEMQEGAEMVAWISQNPPEECERYRKEGKSMIRLLISQDHAEVYLTYATFDAKYVDYVTCVSRSTDSFLIMNQFGPYTVDNKDHMKCLAYYILAFSLQHCS